MSPTLDKAMLTLAQAQALLAGAGMAARVLGEAGTPFARVHSDTRTLRAGDLFVALRGERFDGHGFLPQALAAGAAAALVDEAGATALPAGLPALVVPDTLAALQQLAAAWRARLRLPLVAVVGSNGKTTVTQMLAAILRAAHGDAALATAGNLNNHIGVPLTLLRLRQDDNTWHRSAVLELGMNHPGEIALLAALAAPTVAVVTNAQREHQEFLAGVAAVAQENGAVLDALPVAGVAVLPAADAFAAAWRARAGARRVLSFGLDGESPAAAPDVAGAGDWDAAAARWRLVLRTPQGDVATTLQQPGRHSLRNAAAAAAAALAAGEPLEAVARGLADFRPVTGRMAAEPLRWQGSDATLVDDSYNANPDSVLAAIAVLAALPGPRWLLLGDMGEVGALGPAFHAEVGAAARAAGIEAFWGVGELMRHAGAGRHFDSMDALLAALPQGPAAASLLVKGSRFMRMERVVQALRDRAAGQPG